MQSVLQCVLQSVLQSVLQHVLQCVLQCVLQSVLQCLLQGVAGCCGVLQHVRLDDVCFNHVSGKWCSEVTVE